MIKHKGFCICLSQLLVLVNVSLLLVSNRVHAGGLEVPDLGTVAIGRGTAFVARADNLSAFYYNPAGLSKSKGVNLLLSGNLINVNVDYQRSGSDKYLWVDNNGVDYGRDCDPATGQICTEDPAKDYLNVPDRNTDPMDYRSISSSGFGPAPMLVLNWGDAFNVDGLAFAFGVLPPSSFGTPSYPKNGPQRYVLREAHFLIVYPGLAVSYAINRYIQLGAVFMSGFALLEQSLAIRPLPSTVDRVSHSEFGKNDANLNLDVKDMFMPTGILGVMSNPLDWLELGVAVKLPVNVEAEGKVKYKAPELDLADSKLVSGRDNVTIRQKFPWMVRAGVRYIHRYFDIEADFVWENWSSLETFEIDMDTILDEGTSHTEMPDTEVLKNFRDTYSVRLGGDAEVWPEHIAVRIGGYWQSSAYPENNDTFALDFPFAEQFGVGGGLTWHTCKWLDVNVGYLHVFQLDVEVKEGIVQQQGVPYDTGAEDSEGQPVTVPVGNTVNNGKYEVSMNLFGVSLEGHF